MNKADLVNAVSENKELGVDSKALAERMVNAVIEGIKQGLRSKPSKVQIVGFGSFNVRERKARKGRNPQTGETINIPASKTVGFTPGSALKTLVNNKRRKK